LDQFIYPGEQRMLADRQTKIILCVVAFNISLASCRKLNSVNNASVQSWNDGDSNSWTDLNRYDAGAIDVIDGSGPDGKEGSDASDQSSSFYGSGSSGDNGESGDNGDNGGTIDVSLGYAGSTQFEIIGTINSPKKKGQIHQTYSTASTGDVLLNVNGGKGGRGGEGGDGGRGSSGSNASGTDESGGRGNSGGDGGDGGKGGNGGTVTVRVKEANTELLWLVRASTAGAPGGAGGDDGDGGSGGSGGSGNGTGSSGFSGFGGSDGRDGKDGKSGSDGSAIIQVLNENGGSETYKEMFDLTLKSLRLGQQFEDGIWEPGEIVAVNSITIRNTKSMPTPSKHTVFSIRESGAISGPSKVIEVETEKSLDRNNDLTENFEGPQYRYKLGGGNDHYDSFGFKPAVKIGSKSKEIGGGISYSLGVPLIIEAKSPKFVVQGQSADLSLA
jgi:hypothetical protein